MIHSRDRQILNIAIPSIISNITVPLLGLVDVAIVGHMGNASYIGAIAVGSMIFNVIYWIFGFLRMGTSGMTSQAYGERDLSEVLKLLLRSTGIGLSVALCILISQDLILKGALWFIRPDAEVQPLVHTYFHICIWGAPAMLGLYSLTGWYIGMQNTRIPMLISIMQNIVNIIASLFFVYGAEMKVDGVAFGTLIALYAGFIMAVLLLLHQYIGKLKKYMEWKGIIERTAMSRFFHVNRDIFLRTLFLVAVNLFFTSAGASQGNIILAVNTLLLQLFTLFSYVMDGFAYAGEALGGKYYGARNALAFHDTIKRLFVWGVIMIVGFTLIYLLGGKSFLALLTNDTAIITASLPYLPWAILIPAIGMTAFVWDGVFIGITATRGMLISSAVATILFFVCYYTLKSELGNHALWLAFILYLASRGIVQTYLFPKTIAGKI